MAKSLHCMPKVTQLCALRVSSEWRQQLPQICIFTITHYISYGLCYGLVCLVLARLIKWLLELGGAF